MLPNPSEKRTERQKSCERNAAKRLLDDFRREHPHLRPLSKALFNGPHIKYLKDKGFRFILGAKPGDHKPLFSKFEASNPGNHGDLQEDRTIHQFEWDIGLPLNNSNLDLKINMLKYKETKKNGETTRFSWVTDLPLNRKTVMSIMLAGRRRWPLRLTFRTLKLRMDIKLHKYEKSLGGRSPDARHARFSV